MTTKPKLYSKENRYNIVDYDDDDFMRDLYSPRGPLETRGFHVDYEMWMARKKHDGTWTAEDEAIEEKRQSKIDKAFFRYQQEQTRERVLKRLASAAAEPRTRSGRKPGWFHRKTGRPFPLVGKTRTLVGRGRRTRRRKRHRTRRRKRRRRRTRRGGKFIFDYIKKQAKESDKRRHRAAIQGWHHRLEYPKYVHTLPRKTSTHKTSRHTRRKMKRVSVTPRHPRSYMWAHRGSKHRKKMEHADRWVGSEHWTASRRKYKVKKSRKSRKSSKKN